jgi:adenylosuccinate lyase
MNKSLFSISPVDGRYAAKTEELVKFFSEFALIKYRVFIEIEYFLELCRVIPALKSFPTNKVAVLNKINTEFSTADALRIKEIESITNHDVKAVEYFLKEKFDENQMSEYKEYIHFGLTSQDVNNTATPLSLKDAVENVYYPLINKIIDVLNNLSNQWKDVSMLARTHGQPASPTRLGKEISVFTERIQVQLKQLQSIPWSAKFGGATGNFNAHHVAFPNVNWNEFAEKFVNIRLKLNRSYPTTQIEHYDNIAAVFHGMARINTILLDLSRDIWTYVSMDYFKQAIKKGEVGSSAMPHKVNPIDFENAEGNLGIANALFSHLADKLPISRLQRDLTDSTVLRNIGVPFGHSIIAFNSIIRGLNKLELNQDKINQDLTDNYIVIAEAIQTVLRRENYPNPYEALKELTRTNKKITKEIFDEFIKNLDIGEEIKIELLNITPFNYTGLR